MADLLLPALIAAFAWWFSTGAIFWLVARAGEAGGEGERRLLLGAATLGASGAGLLGVTAGVDTPAGAYASFAGALMVWGAIEISFLTGAITGPNRASLPAGMRGLARFWRAAGAVIHHELLIAFVTLAAVVGLWGAANPAGLLALAALAALRLSAKLNIFLGAPQFSDELLPQRLAYMKSYFRRGPFNALFPVSMLIGAIAVMLLIATALAAPAESAQMTACALCATLVLLGLLEHALMMTPLDDTALWRWAQTRHANAPLRPVPPLRAPEETTP